MMDTTSKNIYVNYIGCGDGSVEGRLICMLRKVVLVSLLLALSTGLAYSATGIIEVTKPADQDSFIQDQIMTINWSNQGQAALYVAIHLVDESGSNIVKTIAGKTMNDGIYKWKIPLDLAPANYRVKVVSSTVNAEDVSGLFEVKQKLVWHAPTYAMIASLKVNGQSPTDSCVNTTNRVSINIQDGIQIWVTATSVITPIQYKYRVELTDPYTGYDYAIYDGGWVKQSILNLNPTYNEVLDKVFPNGVGGSEIPVSLQGRVSVKVKNAAQTEPPQLKEICIRLAL